MCNLLRGWRVLGRTGRGPLEGSPPRLEQEFNAAARNVAASLQQRAVLAGPSQQRARPLETTFHRPAASGLRRPSFGGRLTSGGPRKKQLCALVTVGARVPLTVHLASVERLVRQSKARPSYLCGGGPRRGLTLRSRGRAPAWHLAREALWYIIRLAGQAPYRRAPLSSNVRPRARWYARHPSSSNQGAP